MIRLLNILVSGMDIPEEPFKLVCSIYPEAVSGPIFNARLPDSDPRTEKILEALRSHGVKELGSFDSPEKNSFRARPNYVYEDADFKSASYFTFVSSVSLRSLSQQNIEEVLKIYVPKQKKSFEIAECGIYSGTVVSNVTKKRMENQGLCGLVFLQTEFIDEKGRTLKTNKVPNAPFWQVRSTIELPELHPKCLKLDQDGHPCNGDYSRGCFLVEDDFPAGELHYTPKSLEMIEPFDIAVTHEAFGNSSRRPTAHKLVVSSGFRNYVQELDPKATWYPVYVHD